jgi:GNAT superfamily N-acetyltransferase
MEITPATPRDLPQLAGLLATLFAQEADFEPDHARQIRGLERILAEPWRGTLLVARDGEEVIGMVNLLYTISTAEGALVALLEDMVVARGQRGRGTGSRLLTAALAHCRAQGCTRITLLTDGSNEAAQRFYARHGFVQSAMVPMRRHLD